MCCIESINTWNLNKPHLTTILKQWTYVFNSVVIVMVRKWMQLNLLDFRILVSILLIVSFNLLRGSMFFNYWVIYHNILEHKCTNSNADNSAVISQNSILTLLKQICYLPEGINILIFLITKGIIFVDSHQSLNLILILI